jgi:hypothetical protein
MITAVLVLKTLNLIEIEKSRLVPLLGKPV